MRQLHRAGEKLFIDYCGPTVDVVEPSTGEVHAAAIFVAVWGASNYTYAEATRTQSLPDWIASHQRALRYFGGCPVLLVPFNLCCHQQTPGRQNRPLHQARSPHHAAHAPVLADPQKVQEIQIFGGPESV